MAWRRPSGENPAGAATGTDVAVTAFWTHDARRAASDGAGVPAQAMAQQG